MSSAKAAAVIGIPKRVAPWGKLTHWLLAWVLLLFGISCLGLMLGGYTLNSTQGDSMDPTIASGSLILVRPTLPEHVRVGDIIEFPDPSGEFPLVVHRVVALLRDAEHITAGTKGDNNPMSDPIPFTLDKPVGRVIVVMPDLVSRGTLTLAWGLLATCAFLGHRFRLRRRWPGATRRPHESIEADATIGSVLAVCLGVQPVETAAQFSRNFRGYNGRLLTVESSPRSRERLSE